MACWILRLIFSLSAVRMVSWRKSSVQALAANEDERCATVFIACHFSRFAERLRMMTADFVSFDLRWTLDCPDSGFVSGNRTTSRRLSCSVRMARIRSSPIPNQDWGGIPCSIASTKSSSHWVASRSQRWEAWACFSKFSFCRRGSTSSE